MWKVSMLYPNETVHPWKVLLNFSSELTNIKKKNLQYCSWSMTNLQIHWWAMLIISTWTCYLQMEFRPRARHYKQKRKGFEMQCRSRASIQWANKSDRCNGLTTGVDRKAPPTSTLPQESSLSQPSLHYFWETLPKLSHLSLQLCLQLSIQLLSTSILDLYAINFQVFTCYL